MHYETAAMTGLRASELRALTAGDFDFENNVVRLDGRYTKNRKPAVIPLKPDFAARLKAFLAGKLPTAAAFKTPASGHEVRVLRQDLKAAGIPEIDDEGRVFDFHSFRVFYASMLAASGTNPKTAMELLRHSDIRLTMNIYSMAFRESLAAAVDTLPDLTADDVSQAKATGTDDAIADAVSLVKMEPKSLSAPLSDFSTVKRNSAKPNENIQIAQNALKQGFGCEKTHSWGQEPQSAKSAQNWRRGDSNPRPEIHNIPENQGLTENAKNVLSAPLSDARTETLKKYPELLTLIDRWDTLPSNVRAVISTLAQVDLEKPTGKQ